MLNVIAVSVVMPLLPMLSTVILIVFMLNVVVLNVVAPNEWRQWLLKKQRRLP
jgi:hypothetical protein